MKYIQCPEIYTGKDKSLFLGGGITRCPDWQSDLVKLLGDTDLTLINPRRKSFLDSPEMVAEQIGWEFDQLDSATAVSFWFPKETLCPITLYELGKKIVGIKPVFIGLHPNYARRIDIEIQTKLERPNLKIVYTIPQLAEQIRGWANDR